MLLTRNWDCSDYLQEAAILRAEQTVWLGWTHRDSVHVFSGKTLDERYAVLPITQALHVRSLWPGRENVYLMRQKVETETYLFLFPVRAVKKTKFVIFFNRSKHEWLIISLNIFECFSTQKFWYFLKKILEKNLKIWSFCFSGKLSSFQTQKFSCFLCVFFYRKFLLSNAKFYSFSNSKILIFFQDIFLD